MTDQNTEDRSRAQARARSQSVTAGLAMILSSSYGNMLLGALRGILVMRAIGPTARGLMRLVYLFQHYLSNCHLGSLHGLSKELPIALGCQDEADATRIEDVGTTTVIVLSTLGSLGMLAWAMVGSRMEPLTRFTLGMGAAIVLGDQAIAIHRVVLRAWGTYSVLAIAAMVTSVSQFALIVGGAALYGLAGAMWGWLASVVVTLLYFEAASKLRIQLSMQQQTVWRLIRIGMPLAAILFGDVLLRTIDGVLVVRYFDAYHFGLYSMAMQIAAYLYRVPEAGGFVLMPRMWERYGAAHRLEDLRDYVVRPTLAAGLIMPVLSGFAFILMPVMVNTILPQFSPAVYAAQVLSLSAVFLALPVAANGALIAFNEEKKVIAIKLLGAGVVAGGTLLVLTTTPSLARIAMAAGSGYFVVSITILYIVLRRYYRNRFKLWAELVICYLPLLWALGALKISGMATDLALGGHFNVWIETLVRCAIFGVLSLPVVWYAEWRTGLIRQARQQVRQGLAKRRASDEDQEW